MTGVLTSFIDLVFIDKDVIVIENLEDEGIVEEVKGCNATAESDDDDDGSSGSEKICNRVLRKVTFIF